MTTSLKEVNKREVLYLHYFHDTFTTNYKWYIVICSNLSSKLKLLFCPPITTNNNLPFKICCENVVNIPFL